MADPRTDESRKFDITSNSSLKCFFILVTAAIVSTLFDLVVKFYEWLPPLQFSWLSCSTVLFLALPIWITRTRFDAQSVQSVKNKKLVFLWLARDTSGTLSTVFLYLALKNLSPSVVFIITSSSPFIAAILARIFLGEPLTSVKLFGLIFTVTGMVLAVVAHTTAGDLSVTSSVQILGLVYSVLSALSSGSLFVLWKNLPVFHGSSLLLTSAVNGIIFSLSMSMAFETFVIPPCGLAGWVVALCGVANILTGLLLHLACRFGEGGVISALMAGLCVVFAFIWQLLLFQYHPGTIEWIAGFLVICGTAVNSLSNKLAKFKLFGYAI